jgi:hypothetical protein
MDFVQFRSELLRLSRFPHGRQDQLDQIGSIPTRKTIFARKHTVGIL